MHTLNKSQYLEQNDLKKFNAALYNQLSKEHEITLDDICYCGSHETFKNCCMLNANFWISDKYLVQLIKFIEYHNYFVQNIPTSFLNDFRGKFFAHFKTCILPTCKQKMIGSHVFSEKLVKKCFQSDKCKWYITDNEGNKKLQFVGIRDGIKYPIFCADCDNLLFKNIDDTKHDTTSKTNIVLHMLRCIAFQYQSTRVSLSLSHQLIFSTPIFEHERERYTQQRKKFPKIDVGYFMREYGRCRYHKDILDKLWRLQSSKKIDSEFRYHNRIINTKAPCFAQGIVNPKLDSVTPGKYISIIYVVIPIDERKISITIATLDNEYFNYIDKTKKFNDYQIKTLINTFTSNKNYGHNLLLPKEHQSHQKAVR